MSLIKPSIAKAVEAEKKEAELPGYKLLRNQRILNSKGDPIPCTKDTVYPRNEEEVALCEYMVGKGILASLL